MPRESEKRKFLKTYERIKINDLWMLDVLETDEEKRNRKRCKIFENYTLVLAAAEYSRYSFPFIHNSVPKSKKFLSDVLLNLDEKRFKQIVRVDKKSFAFFISLIESHEVFEGARSGKQFPVQTQLLIVLYGIGVSGEGATVVNIASLFGVGDGGTIEAITKRVFKTILSLKTRFLSWPSESERQELVTKTMHELPYCIGYVDGTEVQLAERPLEDPESYYSRKQVFSIKVQAVCDMHLRVRHMVVGYPGSVHDARIYNECDLSTYPHDFFSEPQWLAGDSAYKLTSTVLSPFRSNRLSTSSQQRADFNKVFSQYRIRIEHTFGILKERFGSLKELRIQIKDNVSIAFACQWIIVCSILHNILIGQKDSFNDFLDNNSEEIESPENTTNVSVATTSEGELKRFEIMRIMNI